MLWFQRGTKYLSLIEDQRFFGEDRTFFDVHEARFELVFLEGKFFRIVYNWQINSSIRWTLGPLNSCQESRKLGVEVTKTRLPTFARFSIDPLTPINATKIFALEFCLSPVHLRLESPPLFLVLDSLFLLVFRTYMALPLEEVLRTSVYVDIFTEQISDR